MGYVDLSDEGGATRAGRRLVSLGEQFSDADEPPDPESVVWGDDDFGTHMREEYLKLVDGTSLPERCVEEQRELGEHYRTVGEAVQQAVHETVLQDLVSAVQLGNAPGPDDVHVARLQGPEPAAPTAPAATTGAGEPGPEAPDGALVAGRMYQVKALRINPDEMPEQQAENTFTGRAFVARIPFSFPTPEDQGGPEPSELTEQTEQEVATTGRLYRSASWTVPAGQEDPEPALTEPVSAGETGYGSAHWLVPGEPEPSHPDLPDQALSEPALAESTEPASAGGPAPGQADQGEPGPTGQADAGGPEPTGPTTEDPDPQDAQADPVRRTFAARLLAAPDPAEAPDVTPEPASRPGVYQAVDLVDIDGDRSRSE